MNLEAQLSRAGYAYDNRMPDEDTAAEEAYRELERITDDPDELQEALAEDGVERGLARVIAARYATADTELRCEIDAVVEGVVKKRGEIKIKTRRAAETNELVDWILSLSARVLELEKAAIRECRLPTPESAETSREGHNTESMK